MKPTTIQAYKLRPGVLWYPTEGCTTPQGIKLAGIYSSPSAARMDMDEAILDWNDLTPEEQEIATFNSEFLANFEPTKAQTDKDVVFSYHSDWLATGGKYSPSVMELVEAVDAEEDRALFDKLASVIADAIGRDLDGETKVWNGYPDRNQEN